MEDQLESLLGACGLVAGAPGARQTPGRLQPVGYVGQAHLHTHVCVFASAVGCLKGVGGGWAGGMPAVPASPCQGLRDPGTRQEPQPICDCASPLAEPLCYLILAFEGRSQHLAPLVRLVPGGSPRGSLCPWLSQITLSSLPAHLATNTLVSARCVPETGQNPFPCVKGALTHLILESTVRGRLFWWGQGLTFFQEIFPKVF